MKKYQITDCNGNILGEGKTRAEAVQSSASNMNENAEFIDSRIGKPYSGEETTYFLKEIDLCDLFKNHKVSLENGTIIEINKFEDEIKIYIGGGLFTKININDISYSILDALTE